MTIREAIREQQKSIKNRSAKEKLSYFWEYHGIKTICLIIALVIVIAFIVTMVTQKKPGFTGVFFGVTSQSSSEKYLADFASAAGIDPAKYQLTVQESLDIRMDQSITPDIYQSMETFAAMVASKSVDCFAGNRELFLYYAYTEYAVDLQAVLTPEELESLSPYLHYIDRKVLEEAENADDRQSVQYPDSTKPELMADPIPVAVSLDAATDAFKEAYHFDAGCVIGICASSEQMENARSFFRYCLGLS